MHLDIQVGEHAIDYSNTAHKEKFTELQLRIHQLLDQVEQITKEQNYQRVSHLFIFFIVLLKIWIIILNCLFTVSRRTFQANI